MRTVLLGLALIACTAAAEEPESDVPPGWTAVGPAQKPPVEEQGPTRWHAMGIAGGAGLGSSFGALPLFLATTLSRTPPNSSCSGSICAVAALSGLGIGLVVGGLFGWRLGVLASEGQTWAKVLIVVFDIVGLPISIAGYTAAVLATGNLPVGGG